MDFSCGRWSGDSATLAAPPRTSPGTTGNRREQGIYCSILIGQECEYTDAHWSESEGCKKEKGQVLVATLAASSTHVNGKSLKRIA